MGSKNLVYRKKLEEILKESFLHLKRLKDAFYELNKRYSLPLKEIDKDNILGLNIINLIYENLDEFEKILKRIEKLKE